MNFTLKSEPRNTTISFKDTALLVIDCQRDFLEIGGFAEDGLRVNIAEAQKIISPLKNVIAFARSNSIPVIHMREAYSKGLTDLNSEHTWYEIIGKKGHGGWHYLIYGERGHEIIPELAPLEGEYIIDKAGKNGVYDPPPEEASTQQSLLDILKKLHIKNVLVAGVATSVCVNDTARSLRREFLPILIEDCCGDYEPRLHEWTLLNFGKRQQTGDGLYGRTTHSESIIKILKS